MAKRHALSDKQWEAIRELLPGKAGDPGRSGEDNRLFVDAVLYALKTGIPWDDLPERFGKPNTVWKRFDRWCKNDVWRRVFHALGEEELEEELEEVSLDSSSVKAHPVASTGRRRRGEKEAAATRRRLGRSRGGLTTKIHALTGKSGRLVDFVLTAGQRGDAPQAEALLQPFESGQIGAILADTAYDSDAIRDRGKRLKARVCIKPNACRRRKPRYETRIAIGSNASSAASNAAGGSLPATRKNPRTTPASSGSQHSSLICYECPYCLGHPRENRR